MNDDCVWICININVGRIKKARSVSSVRRELEEVFEDDMHDMLVVGDWISDDSAESCVDNYVFVKCSDYFNHVGALRASPLVSGVLDSYDNPSFIPVSDVASFRRSIRKKRESCCFGVGDFVRIKEGYLKGLVGVVSGVHKGGQVYDVMFKLFTSSFGCSISVMNMNKIANIFDIMKFPVSEKPEDEERFVSNIKKRLSSAGFFVGDLS